jgi:hypothetical protein
LLETVSDHQCVLQLSPVPAETVLPWRVIDYARRLRRVKYPLCLSTLFDRRRISGGKFSRSSTHDELV